MGKPKYRYEGSKHYFRKQEDGSGWLWVGGIVVFLIILAAA